MVSPFSNRCGIATYSEYLCQALGKLGVEVYGVKLPRFGDKTPELLQNVVDKIPRDVDCIHVQHEVGLYQFLEPSFYAGLKLLGKPVVTTIHAPGFKGDFAIKEGSNAVIVHNDFCAKRFDGESVVIPHGTSVFDTPKIEDCKKSYGVDSRIPVVGYLGFIAPQKGLEILISAMTKIDNVALLICGGWHLGEGNSYIYGLKEKTLKLLPGRCQWTGFVPDDQLSTAYGAMDILVYPSSYATESGGLLLGLSHGKAVIASGAIPFEEKEQQGALITFYSVDDLTKKIKAVLSSADLKHKLEDGAKKFAYKNRWEVVAQKHIDLYNKVLSSYKKVVIE